MTRHKVQPSLTKEVSLGAALSSWPTTPVVPEIREEGCTPVKEEEEEEEKKAEKVEEEPKTPATTRERLTTRMKSLLRRRTDKKKAEKKERYFELDRVETTHWTEL
jgi:prophage antirepressor-like protein